MISICPDPDPWFKHSKGGEGLCDTLWPLEGHRESKSWGQAAHTAAPSLSWARLASPEGLGCGEEMLLNDLWTWRPGSQKPPSQCRGLWPQTSFCCCIRCHWTGAASGQCDHPRAELDIMGALCSQVRMEKHPRYSPVRAALKEHVIYDKPKGQF